MLHPYRDLSCSERTQLPVERRPISIKASCIDSTAEPAAEFAAEVNKMKTEKMKPREQLTLEPFERDHAVAAGE